MLHFSSRIGNDRPAKRAFDPYRDTDRYGRRRPISRRQMAARQKAILRALDELEKIPHTDPDDALERFAAELEAEAAGRRSD